MGAIDDPVWTEDPPPAVSSVSRSRTTRNRWIFAAVACVVLAVGGWLLFGGGPSSGDPGEEVMNQLVPAASALPGYGTAALPWVRQLPPSLGAAYIIKDEPLQDSCDGISGTQGWSQVVVQAGFPWSQGLPALLAYMEPKLERLGWSAMVQPAASSPPNQTWTKTLTNGTRADLDVTEEGGTDRPVWEFVALGQPIGKPASC